MKQSNLLFTQSSHGTSKNEEKPKEVINLITPEKSEGVNEKPKTEAELYSKVVKVPQVETFDWTYIDQVLDSKSDKLVDKEVTLEKIEAIYINPKWK